MCKVHKKFQCFNDAVEAKAQFIFRRGSVKSLDGVTRRFIETTRNKNETQHNRASVPHKFSCEFHDIF